MWDIREAARAIGAELLRPRPPYRITGAACDSRRVRPGELFVAIAGKRHDGHDFLEEAFARGAAGALVSRDPGVGHNLVLVEDTVAALWELARWRRESLSMPTVGITGSFGKTTSKELLAAALGSRFAVYRAPESFNTEIGVPLAVLSVPDDVEIAVFELGMSGRGEIARLCELVRPWAGLITGVGEAHLGPLGSREEIAAAKWELAQALPEEGVLVLAWDHPELRARVEDCQALCLRFGHDPSADFHPRSIVASDPQGVRFVLESPAGSFKVKLKLLGRHVAVLASGVLALAWAMGVPLEAAVPALGQVSPLPHRLHLIPTWFGWLLDDCYNANPQSVRAALETLVSLRLPVRRRAVLLGDMLDLGPREGELHREVVSLMVRMGVDALYAYGPRTSRAWNAVWKGEGMASEELDPLLERIREDLRGAPALLLVKGSRGMALERAVEALRE